ncbi:3-oxoacyl-[ACP] synthase III in alkane synthesis cluster [Planctomycetales bacterium 10988]|nr:3-oxoacyl-[ACP] synthase III in alkane synthesis cluster [Planctomycetales bacterium 10988]
MRYKQVCLEGFGYTLPEEVVPTSELESRLEPLYRRLRLPEGRLELMTGIRERRFWEPNTLPSQKSVQSVQQLLEKTGFPAERIGALIHASVCRDYLEPATACVVHSQLGFPESCLLYDISNACLGFLNGVLQVANLIELGQIEAGIVVATEGSRELVENTIEHLNQDESLTRDQVKYAIASLTIGSGSVACLLTRETISNTKDRICGGIWHTDTRGAGLCHSGRDDAVSHNMRPLMRTDSEALMHAGIEVGRQAFDRLLDSLEWDRDQLDKTICHQIGTTHRKLMFEALQLDLSLDFPTVQYLGNTGSVAMPITAAIAQEEGFFQPGDQIAFLGIGSGINSVMLGVEWQSSSVSLESKQRKPAQSPLPTS